MNSSNKTQSITFPLKKDGDKITVDYIPGNKELHTVSIILTIVAFVFCLLMYILSNDINFVVLVGGVCLLVHIHIFGFKSEYFFNTRTNKVIKEGIRFFIPYSK